MKLAGVDVQYYHPLRWHSFHRANNRTHRKILVVDGQVGFTGGICIADCWTGNAQDHWRDSQFRLEGPAVAQMQSAFMDNWVKTKGGVLHGDAYFPPLECKEQGLAQVFQRSPGAGSNSMRLMYQLAIMAARQTIRLSCSYFVPDWITIEVLTGARRRGVKVQIIVPDGYIDSRVVRWASRSRWTPLLKDCVEIYEYLPTMYHCKVMIVDDLLLASARQTSTADHSISTTRPTSTCRMQTWHGTWPRSSSRTGPHRGELRYGSGTVGRSTSGYGSLLPGCCDYSCRGMWGFGDGVHGGGLGNGNSGSYILRRTRAADCRAVSGSRVSSCSDVCRTELR